MIEESVLLPIKTPRLPEAAERLGLTRPTARRTRYDTPAAPFRFSAFTHSAEDEPQRQAELFYLQKQIQTQTPMVLILEDGEQIEGCIEWYDRHSLKVRGRSRLLVYKSSIKYMYKQGEAGA